MSLSSKPQAAQAQHNFAMWEGSASATASKNCVLQKEHARRKVGSPGLQVVLQVCVKGVIQIPVAMTLAPESQEKQG